MLLTVNVSNTSVLLGIFDGENLMATASMHTDENLSRDEYAVKITMLLQLRNIDISKIDGVIMSCVVPSVEGVIKSALGSIYGKKIFCVGPGLKTGVKIHTEIPSQVGSSLICQSAAILNEFSAPCLLISMGTALSMFAIDKDGCFVGGSILPGIKMSAKALSLYTAQLPNVDVNVRVKSVIGTNSVQNIQSGLVIGTACSIDGMIDKFKEELGPRLVCVGTGQFLPNIMSHCRNEIIYRENLVLEGMRLIYNKNTK